MSADLTRKRKAPAQEAVPDVGDPDRKRVLNVLAQRRYRKILLDDRIRVLAC